MVVFIFCQVFHSLSLRGKLPFRCRKKSAVSQSPRVGLWQSMPISWTWATSSMIHHSPFSLFLIHYFLSIYISLYIFFKTQQTKILILIYFLKNCKKNKYYVECHFLISGVVSLLHCTFQPLSWNFILRITWHFIWPSLLKWTSTLHPV